MWGHGYYSELGFIYCWCMQCQVNRLLVLATSAFTSIVRAQFFPSRANTTVQQSVIGTTAIINLLFYLLSFIHWFDHWCVPIKFHCQASAWFHNPICLSHHGAEVWHCDTNNGTFCVDNQLPWRCVNNNRVHVHHYEVVMMWTLVPIPPARRDSLGPSVFLFAYHNIKGGQWRTSSNAIHTHSK